jgi:phasin family protein
MPTPRATKTERTAEATAKAGQDAPPKGCEQPGEQAGQQFFDSYEEFAAFGKQNVDALVQSTTVVAKGVEELSRAMFGFVQTTFEAGAATGKAMLGVRTLNELVTLQNEYVRTSLDSVLSESVKLSELTVKVANEALEPIGARFGAVIEKLTRPLAA